MCLELEVTEIAFGILSDCVSFSSSLKDICLVLVWRLTADWARLGGGLDGSRPCPRLKSGLGTGLVSVCGFNLIIFRSSKSVLSSFSWIVRDGWLNATCLLRRGLFIGTLSTFPLKQPPFTSCCEREVEDVNELPFDLVGVATNRILRGWGEQGLMSDGERVGDLLIGLQDLVVLTVGMVTVRRPNDAELLGEL